MWLREVFLLAGLRCLNKKAWARTMVLRFWFRKSGRARGGEGVGVGCHSLGFWKALASLGTVEPGPGVFGQR